MPQSPRNESPMEPIQGLPAAVSAMKLPKTRHSAGTDSLPMSRSDSAQSFRRSNPSAASLYASTLSPPGSRPISPSGRNSPSRVVSGSVFASPSGRALPESAADNPGEPLSLILKAFVPHVSVYTSDDTEALIREKGFQFGLWELLRPFGENIHGKVTVRDSTGVGRTTEDFSIRFTKFGENVESLNPETPGPRQAEAPGSEIEAQEGISRDRVLLADIESVVDRHLRYAEESAHSANQHNLPTRQQGTDMESASPYYALYLRRLLSGTTIAPHETFTHPVACVIAISSRNETPIEALRRLYTETNQGPQKLPAWVDGEYLRYYVLVHDEENDDITRSMGLFDQMKRHLGLHCHLLRLRRSQTVETDDDSIPLPRSDWMSAEEELAELRRSDDDADFGDPTRYIFESDATAIRTFVREMVTQSIIPTMERNVSSWNEHVASRRRGITGRFMNLSRKWAGFGGSSKSSSGGAGNQRDSYDTTGFYHAEAAEAIMRKLADFAFMLRDWRLAQSTYDLLRSDFNEAKAWKYHAATNEMAALSLLLIPQQLTSKNRAETVDQMLEAAFYSYNSRCTAPYGAMRSLILGQELLRLRGGSNIDDAGRWCLRLLESKILGQVGDALLKERLAICYASKAGVGSLSWGSRRRKSAVWSVLAADAWTQQAKYIPAQKCLRDAQGLYDAMPDGHGISHFAAAREHIAALEHELADELEVGASNGADSPDNAEQDVIDEESEALTDTRARRSSVAGRGGLLETAPLHGEGTESDTPEDATQQGFG